MNATPSTETAGAAAGERLGGPVTAAGWWAVARRPRWLALLVLVLAVAAVFAALAQWQAGRAVEQATSVDVRDTESAVPLSSVDTPQTSVTGVEAGQIVTVTGRLVVADTTVLSDRLRAGTTTGVGADRGFWLVGQLVDDRDDSIAVALGWAPDRSTADRVRQRLIDDAALAGRPESGVSAMDALVVTGRYLPSESPQEDDLESGQRRALSSAELVNEWSDVPGRVYGGYVVASAPVDGLREIVSPPPEAQESLNWLNVFYAVEWVIFGGFAFYLWYRLVRDALEKELDEAAAGTSGAASLSPEG